jgi:hypothetical protein
VLELELYLINKQLRRLTYGHASFLGEVVLVCFEEAVKEAVIPTYGHASFSGQVVLVCLELAVKEAVIPFQ